MKSEWVHKSQIGHELIATEAEDGDTELIYIGLSAIWSRLPLEHVKMNKNKMLFYMYYLSHLFLDTSLWTKQSTIYYLFFLKEKTWDPKNVRVMLSEVYNETEINYYPEATDFVQSLSAAAAAKSLQSCPTLCDPIDGSPPGSPVPGFLHARTLGWVAISFSNAWKWSRSVVSDS